ncbi:MULTISPECIES: MarR family winged helix-turn-helix transcriptional regulator [Rhizobium]|jgi:DNA-binding MarR family transcriptional regulator|uniref:MarR family transcriptional regulator n=1 Tax=Rhizobium anhuiense TaxID=1184720 RepID=A0A432N8K7_9HYPH|nr:MULTISPECIES: MarR family transcriptional regulator [Rhizobium]KZS56004.1 MarR family transcriptional regulator [Rhizobium anhuiense bv. trifolii]MBB3301905.1 DNA-binding MarR family transcriptional regulator [Rhizobium sp. BK112]MBB3371104.1 DNA-binding MarR family transcriptional regulator [Rhizobium sp. BK077]MBB3746394.1 DNA-binding MarR family transcriptional regulator [Rhizobium sp. BK591]MBB4116064.1 DNA-binding MarR family transcriptional regulator [Rhizobium sp. BK226]
MSYRFTGSFPYLLNRVGVRMGELFSERLHDFDVTLPMYRVLAILKQEGPQRLTDLSPMVTVELSTLSRLVTVMKKKELVSRTRPDDGRTVSIALTPSGDALVQKLMPLAAEFEAVGVETFSEAEVAWLKSALKIIHTNLDKLEAR